MAPHSSTLAWKIPWMEEPGGLQSMGSWRVGHDWSDSAAAAAAAAAAAESILLMNQNHQRCHSYSLPCFLPYFLLFIFNEKVTHMRVFSTAERYLTLKISERLREQWWQIISYHSGIKKRTNQSKLARWDELVSVENDAVESRELPEGNKEQLLQCENRTALSLTNLQYNRV